MHSTLPLSDNNLQQTVRRTRRPEVYRPEGFSVAGAPILSPRPPCNLRVGMFENRQMAEGGGPRPFRRQQQAALSTRRHLSPSYPVARRQDFSPSGPKFLFSSISIIAQSYSELVRSPRGFRAVPLRGTCALLPPARRDILSNSTAFPPHRHFRSSLTS